jgi:hypothetical protein
MPKLIRQFARRTALSTRAAVRSRSPAPITTVNPAARAIFASAARPEVQSTVDNRCIRTFPNSYGSNAGPSDRIRTGLTSDPRLMVDNIKSEGKRHVIACRAAAASGETPSRPPGVWPWTKGRGPAHLRPTLRQIPNGTCREFPRDKRRNRARAQSGKKAR